MPEKNFQPAQPQEQRTRRWKRTAAAALLLLVGGATVNVAVAWGCAAWLTPSAIRVEQSTSLPDRPPFEWWETVNLLGVAVVFAAIDRVDVHMEPSSGYVDETSTWHVPLDPDAAVIFDGRGWPCISTWSRYRLLGAESFVTPLQPEGAIATGLPPVQMWGTFQFGRGLPCRVIPFGFLLNTVFYALLLWLIFLAPFAARRVLRRKRRLCEKCAYPVGPSPVCTECGAAVRLRVEK